MHLDGTWIVNTITNVSALLLLATVLIVNETTFDLHQNSVIFWIIDANFASISTDHVKHLERNLEHVQFAIRFDSCLRARTNFTVQFGHISIQFY